MKLDLEGELRTQLDRARIAHHRDRPKKTGRYIGAAKSLEVRVIENVEGFQPELESESFRDMKVLEKRGIRRPVSWA